MSDNAKKVPERNTEGKRKASPIEVAQAVFWSFLGIRKRRDYDRDAVSISPVQVVIAGIIGGIFFVLTLLVVVRYVLSK